jgi:hypothetical protein
MTNLVNKQNLVDAISNVMNGLELFDGVAETLAGMGASEVKGRQTGARMVLSTVRQGLIEGRFDASLQETLAECGIATYDGEDLDTEDMDDEAPEEESTGGIVIPDTATTPEEHAELVSFYRGLGFDIQ